MSSHGGQFLAWIAIILTFSLSAAAEPPTTYYVDGACGNNTWTGTSPICQAPNGPKRTISAAMAATSAGDNVVVADGTYTGAENTNIAFPAHTVRVRSANGRANCIIDCEGISRAFLFQGSSLFSSLTGFTVRNGMATRGGAVFILDSTPLIEDCSFIGCDADLGGAIYVENNNVAETEITGCTFQGNTASSFGGAVYMNTAFASANIADCTFFSNSADAGGAIYNDSSSPELSGCRFFDNSATRFGGAITNSNSRPAVSDCDFEGNSSGQGGGAIASSGGSGPDVKKCRFSGNMSLDGGAIINFEGVGTTVTNCEFRNNTATRSGGGMHNDGGGPDVNSCTFTGNSAGEGGLGGAISAIFGSTTRVTNSILWGNTPNEIRDQTGATTSVFYSDVQGGWPGAGNIDVNPMFVDPLGGDLHTTSGSPVNDAGANLLVPTGVTIDLDGNPRFVDDPGSPNTGLPGGGHAEIIDMGAYEFQGELCYADCDQSGALDIFDFLCFQNSFVSGETYACGCDPDPACNIFDFLCFQNAFVAGCP